MKSKWIFAGSFFVLIVLLVTMGLAIDGRQKPRAESPFTGPTKPDRFSIMSYNVENLFDSEHDPGKNDIEFLPLREKRSQKMRDLCQGDEECLDKDWSEFVVSRKLKAISDVILQIHGQGPDILILQEIENKKILARLSRALPNSRYQTQALIEGQDPRGIDVAILSRFPKLGEAKLHHVDGHARGILEVKLMLPDLRVLTVYGFHFPSQYHSVKRREEAIKKLAQLVSATVGDVVAAGDSNISERESDRLNKNLTPFGKISHQIGCRSCSGTHFFRGHWNFFDWIFFSNSIASRVDPSSIITPKWSWSQVSRTGTPIRFNEFCRRQRCLGASDHLPIYAEIKH